MGKFEDEVRNMYQKQIDPEVSKILGEIKELKMLKDIKTKKFADEGGYADKLAKKFGKSLKTTQLRKFFSAIKDINNDLKDGKSWGDVEGKYYLLKPKIANAKGRGLIPEEFYVFMKTCMAKIDHLGSDGDKKNNFNRFVEFLEAVVAYHKYHYPKSQ